MQDVVSGHASCLHFDANFASGFFASKCNRHLHGNAHNEGMTEGQEERDRLSAALNAFWETHKARGLKSVRQWALASKLSPSTINPVLKGTANKRLEDETYFKLAVGAADLLGRSVAVAELKGDLPDAVALTDRQRRALAALARLPEDRQDEEIAVLEARAAAMKPPAPHSQGE